MWLNYLTLRFHSNLLFWWPPMSHASWYSCPCLVPSVWIWAAFVTCFNQEIVINGTVLGLEPWQFPRLSCGGSQLPHKMLNYQEQRRVPEITMWRRMETPNPQQSPKPRHMTQVVPSSQTLAIEATPVDPIWKRDKRLCQARLNCRSMNKESNDCCFKSLNFGIICHTAISNQRRFLIINCYLG